MMKVFVFPLLLVASLASSAQAMSLDWTGGYRFEWTEVDKPSLSSPSQRKAYGTNFLYLSPKIIAADGVNIHSRFDILSSENAAYTNSQVGQIWGLGTPQPRSTEQTNTLSQNQGASNVRVSQLYLNVNQEYGVLTAGRAPYEFGLGMTYNAGKGLFDHWYDTRDMVAYKFIVGNWFFMPLLGKAYDRDSGQGSSISDQLFQLQYENTETKSMIGFVRENRKGVREANDTAVAKFPGAASGPNGEFTMERTSFVISRGWENFGFKLEAGFQNGNTGLIDASGDDVKVTGYGVASEFMYKGEGSSWDLNTRFGMATGDDPGTRDFEGYIFDRNYDVAMLLFNHRLGQRDFLTTNQIKSTTGSVADLGTSVDDEAISNAIYLSPQLTYAWKDKLDVRNTLTYAQLMTKPTNSVDFKKDLGLEWDIELIYKPTENIRWVNQFGILLPGAAFEDGSNRLDKGTTYGFASKAAISF